MFVVDENNVLIVFQDKKIRRTLYNNEWWFVIKDVVSVLTESVNPADYLKKLRKRDESLFDVFKGGGQIVPPLGLEFDTAGGRQMLQCWSTTGIFRLIQSIPSKKAEPFKKWLAKVGYERVQEIQNPELAQKRMKELYRAKGYSDSWIEKRVRGIAIRDELTDEWGKRGVKKDKEYSILTAEISKATFDMTPSEYKDFKKLKNEPLRDHMNDLELIFGMLGERVTTEITKQKDAQEFDECSDAAKRGGNVAGNARKETEKELGRPITSEHNFIDQPENKKLIKKK